MPWSARAAAAAAAFLCLCWTSALASRLDNANAVNAWPWEATASPSQCQKLEPNLLCQNLTYNWTAMPNYVGQALQEEAALEIHQYSPLVKVQCSHLLQPFLCFVYFPFCDPKLGRIPPCHSMCQEARQGCEPLMKKFGFNWPEHLSCDRFPEDKLCAGPEKPKPTRKPPRRCQRIRFPTCQKIGYRRTNMPNWVGQDDVQEAERALETVRPLIEVNCSPQARAFFCSVYLPQCRRGVRLPPCRSLCLSARTGCERLMNSFGFSWPDSMDCARFPSSNCTEATSQ